MDCCVASENDEILPTFAMPSRCDRPEVATASRIQYPTTTAEVKAAMARTSAFPLGRESPSFIIGGGRELMAAGVKDRLSFNQG
jgi:hypothetical protein